MKLVICGAGEYVAGGSDAGAAASDKAKGVVALCALDLKRRGLLDEIVLVGTRGPRMAETVAHLRAELAGYHGLKVELSWLPESATPTDPKAYRRAIDALPPRSAVWIYTPDASHAEIARHALERGQHVLAAKPGFLKAAQARELAAAAREKNLLLMVEYHKRWDPAYRDAALRARTLGAFSHFSSYMSQPKSQLKTFRRWLGSGSDVSYYLNSHHVDLHCWMLEGRAQPAAVSAFRAAGVAGATEDAIGLVVEWKNLETGTPGFASYVAAWIAPERAEVHTQQRFHYLAAGGEIRVDQAHRGYELATDAGGYRSLNPSFMSYTPDEEGRFAGQSCYGYRPFEEFLVYARMLDEGKARLSGLPAHLPTLERVTRVIELLEAGRTSLDAGGAKVVL